MRKYLKYLLLVLFIGGGGLSMWKFGMPLLAGGEGDAVANVAMPLRYVKMQPFTLPVIRDGRVIEHVGIGLKLEVKGLGNEEKVVAMTPQLRDAFISELYALMSLRYVQEKRGNVDLTKRRLLLVCKRVLGPGVVQDVLIDGMTRREL